MHCSVADLFPINLEQVRRTPFEKIFNGLVSEYHYLGYTQPIGEHLKYMAFSGGRPIACLAWGSAPWYIGVRDRFIGWSKKTRERNLHLIANNLRFLILPWVCSKNLASTILSQASKTVPTDWQKMYGYLPVLLETFVDKERFDGASYKAANWIYVGDTKGRGKVDRFTKYPSSIKKIFIYPLSKNCTSFLCDGLH